MKKLIKGVLRQFGIGLVRLYPDGRHELASAPDLSAEEGSIILKAKPFTMTGVERMAALINAVKYVVKSGVPGDIAECGVWRGGSMMVVASTLLHLGERTRHLYLYDTFDGMPEPTAKDRTLEDLSADEIPSDDFYERGLGTEGTSIEQVRRNVLSTGYPKELVHLVKGKVEDTIPETIPGPLALLRLDTAYHSSTRHELQHLYPLLNSKGILIVDDYGHWQGVRDAVDEYFAERDENHYLHRIDYTGRALVKG